MKLTGPFCEYADMPKNLCVMLPHHCCPWGSWLNKAVHHIPLHVRSQCVSRQKCIQQYQHTISHLKHLLSGCTKSFSYTKKCTISKHISPFEAEGWYSQRADPFLAYMEACQLVAGTGGWFSWGSHLSVASVPFLAYMDPCQLVAGTGGWFSWGSHLSVAWWEPCT